MQGLDKFSPLNEGKEKIPKKEDLVSDIMSQLRLDSKEWQWMRGDEVIMLPFKDGGNYDSVVFTDGRTESVYNVLNPITQIKRKGMARKETKDRYVEIVASNENINEGIEKKSEKILKELTHYLTMDKPNSPELQFTFKEIFKSALTDVNDHQGSAKVDSIFPNAKLNSKIESTESSKDFFMGRWSEMGREFAKIAKWDPFYLYQAFNEFAKKNLNKFDIMTILDESLQSFEINEAMSKELKSTIDKKIEIAQMAIDKWGGEGSYGKMKTRLEDIKAGKEKMLYNEAPMVQGDDKKDSYTIFRSGAEIANKIAKIIKKYKKHEAPASSTGAAAGWSGTARATQSGFIKGVCNTRFGDRDNLIIGVQIGSTVDRGIQEKLKQELFEVMYPYDEYNSSDGGVMYQYKYGTNYDSIGLTSSNLGFNDSTAQKLENIMNDK